MAAADRIGGRHDQTSGWPTRSSTRHGRRARGRIDVNAQQRLWQVRGVAEVLALRPAAQVRRPFAGRIEGFGGGHRTASPSMRGRDPVLFGHVGEEICT